MIDWAAEPFESPINKKKRNTNNKCLYFSFLAEAEGFEPPWVLPKRFSRPPRYDRFDKPPFIRLFFSAFSLRCNVYAFASSAAKKLSLFASEQLSLSLD